VPEPHRETPLSPLSAGATFDNTIRLLGQCCAANAHDTPDRGGRTGERGEHGGVLLPEHDETPEETARAAEDEEKVPTDGGTEDPHQAQGL
jgi:hypothetical protein